MSGAKPGYFAHETAVIDLPCSIGRDTRIWHFCHICAGSTIGEGCSLGQNVFVGAGVTIGNRVKIQNNVSVYTGVTIEDEVFLGPSCVLTNVTNPRSQVNRKGIYETTLIRRGATIGANATIVCGVTIGRYAFVAAGAVVSRDVPDYAMMVGVPAKWKGWMSRHGIVLSGADREGIMRCAESGYRYREMSPGVIRCLDLDEEQPLPADKAVGTRAYDAFKQ